MYILNLQIGLIPLTLYQYLSPPSWEKGWGEAKLNMTSTPLNLLRIEQLYRIFLKQNPEGINTF